MITIFHRQQGRRKSVVSKANGVSENEDLVHVPRHCSDNPNPMEDFCREEVVQDIECWCTAEHSETIIPRYCLASFLYLPLRIAEIPVPCKFACFSNDTITHTSRLLALKLRLLVVVVVDLSIAFSGSSAYRLKKLHAGDIVLSMLVSPFI